MYSWTPTVWWFCVPFRTWFALHESVISADGAQVNSWKFEKHDSKTKAMLMDHDRQYATG